MVISHYFNDFNNAKNVALVSRLDRVGIISTLQNVT